MNKKFNFLFFIFFSNITFGQILTSGSIWKFYDNGSINQLNWNQINFDDNSWDSGFGEFGYGEGDETTVVSYGTDQNNKFITTYFRKSLSISSLTDLNCSIKFDDGVVVYFNGIEVYRNFLPPGNIEFTTLATGGVIENSWYDFQIPVGLIQNGINTIAVEVHQISNVSSDLSFDFQISNQISPPAGIYINEFLASNVNSNVDNSGNHYDWFEIFNNTADNLDLANYYVTDDKLNLKKFRFSSQTGQIVIPAGGYKVFWASGNASLGTDHVSWSISKDGEFLGLIDSDGVTVIDSLSFGRQKDDISFGRLYSDINNFVYFLPSSPNAQNSSNNSFLGVLPTPIFSFESGFYTDPFNLNITGTDETANITYSTDCSNPTQNNLNGKSYYFQNNYPQNIGEPPYDLDQKSFRSFSFQNDLNIQFPQNKPNYFSNFSTTNHRYPFIPQLNIPKATIIRAITEKPGYLQSDIVTKTYIHKSGTTNNYSLPIFSLVTQEDNLFDYDKGISVAGSYFVSNFLSNGYDLFSGNFMNSGSQWERAGHVDYFNNEQIKVSSDVGLRIHGKYSRVFEKKSFRIYFSSPQKVFSKEPNRTSKTIVLKYPNPRSAPFNDMGMRLNKGLKIGIQDASPVEAFLNGEYWGIYNLMDHFNEDYLSGKFGGSSSKYDIIKDGLLESGTNDNFVSTQNFLLNNNFSDNAIMDSLGALIDLENYVDYMIAGIYSNNTDWLTNNVFQYRYQNNSSRNLPKSPLDGRWRWLLTDLDNALSEENTNSLHNAFYNPNSFISLLFRKLSENPAYKEYFILRFCDLMNSQFLPSRSLPMFNTMMAEYAPDLHLDYDRWENVSPSQWNNVANQMYTFLNSRNLIQFQNIKDHYLLNDLFNLTVSTNDTLKGFVIVNTININSSTPGISGQYQDWSGKYFKGIPVTIKPKSNSGFKFSHWIHNNQVILDSILIINSQTDESYSAFFEEIITTENPEPLAKELAFCPYSFINWPSSAPAGTYPSNIIFVYFDTDEPGLNAKIEGKVSGRYDYLSKSRINGLGAKGISFINTSSSPINQGFPNTRMGGLVLALNTQGVDSVKISWLARTITSNPRKYGIRLQYREGNLRPFKDFTPIIEYFGSPNANDSLSFESISLPSEIMNKPYVQLLWRYYFRGIGTSGARDQLGIDDIKIVTYTKLQGNYNSLTQFYGNSSKFQLENMQISNSNILIQASQSIVLSPGVNIETGNTFNAEIRTCEY